MQCLYAVRATLLFVFSALLLVTAHAAPSTNSYWSGSYFFINATNDEDKTYNCSVSYSWSYDDFGTRKTQSFNGTFTVQAKWKGNVLRNEGAWVNPKTESGPNVQCN